MQQSLYFLCGSDPVEITIFLYQTRRQSVILEPGQNISFWNICHTFCDLGGHVAPSSELQYFILASHLKVKEAVAEIVSLLGIRETISCYLEFHGLCRKLCYTVSSRAHCRPHSSESAFSLEEHVPVFAGRQPHPESLSFVVLPMGNSLLKTTF